MDQNWPCRSPGDTGKPGLQDQESGCELDMVSKGHCQLGPYRTPQGRLQSKGENVVSCLLHLPTLSF